MKTVLRVAGGLGDLVVEGQDVVDHRGVLVHHDQYRQVGGRRGRAQVAQPVEGGQRGLRGLLGLDRVGVVDLARDRLQLTGRPVGHLVGLADDGLLVRELLSLAAPAARRAHLDEARGEVALVLQGLGQDRDPLAQRGQRGDSLIGLGAADR